MGVGSHMGWRVRVGRRLVDEDWLGWRWVVAGQGWVDIGLSAGLGCGVLERLVGLDGEARGRLVRTLRDGARVRRVA